ncbi:hypothetical protein [Gracilibacillus sp. YIM 98692]|nr:hypothetical protein [Gracilibacillus sp. YIM 98692]
MDSSSFMSIIEMAVEKPSGLVVCQSVEITEPAAGKAVAALSIQAYVG